MIEAILHLWVTDVWFIIPAIISMIGVGVIFVDEISWQMRHTNGGIHLGHIIWLIAALVISNLPIANIIVAAVLIIICLSKITIYEVR